MRVKIFTNIRNTQKLESEINDWLKANRINYIHYINTTSETEGTYGQTFIYYDINDKYANISGAIRGEK